MLFAEIVLSGFPILVRVTPRLERTGKKYREKLHSRKA